MAWELLPTDYKDAVWTGLKRYTEVTNDDGTVSFQDVTRYTNKEKSFFGAKEANRMNEALNTIMSMVENGTDLYTAFQNYFIAQKAAFENKADATSDDFKAYIEGLKIDYRNEITDFEAAQEQIFNIWFSFVKEQLSGDVAGNLLNICNELQERMSSLEYMIIHNDFSAPVATDDDTVTLIVDDNNCAILADWKYKEV